MGERGEMPDCAIVRKNPTTVESKLARDVWIGVRDIGGAKWTGAQVFATSSGCERTHLCVIVKCVSCCWSQVFGGVAITTRLFCSMVLTHRRQ